MKRIKKILNIAEGDKVVWIIVFLLMLFSILAIFSSTTTLANHQKTTRVDLMYDHLKIVGAGLVFIFGLFQVTKIGFFRWLSQFGFILSLALLILLSAHVDFGFIKAQNINGAWRTLKIASFQIHVFEVVKVAMVMYLAWAVHTYKQDQTEGAKSRQFALLNTLGNNPQWAVLKSPLAKRIVYIYFPILITMLLVMTGSNSSAVFIGGIMVMTLLISGMPMKEIFLAGACCVVIVGIAFGLNKATDGKAFGRVSTAISRVSVDYSPERLNDLKPGSKEFRAVLDTILQPNAAKLAIHEGGIIGKGSGGSTQKYIVPIMYGDYMFSFIVEEYGLLGGILIILLYVSLLARGSMISRLCENQFAKTAVGGLTFLISGQAFMHIFVNVDIGPLTGQTLPLVSHGSSAFLMFSIAFGIILSISRMAKNKIKEEEEAAEPLYQSTKDDIQVSMDVLESLDNRE